MRLRQDRDQDPRKKDRAQTDSIVDQPSHTRLSGFELYEEACQS